MALDARNVLMACVTNQIALFAVLIGMGKQHIWRMRQVVTYTIVTKSLSVALVTILLFCLTDAAVLSRPTEAGVRIWRCTNNHRRLHQQISAPAHYRYGVTQVAADTDGFTFVPCWIDGDVPVIMAAETTQRIRMVLVIWIGAPIQVHLGKICIEVNFL